MSFPKSAALAFGATALLFTACTSGSSSSPAPGSISAAVQDLSVDPTGQTTVVVLPNSPASVTPGNFEANGGQIALSVSLSGNQASVVWDEIVNSSDQLRVVGLSGVAQAFSAVTSSDMTAPSFSITGGTQVAGLGGDSFQLNFTGPRLIESQVEDASNWVVLQDGQSYPLAGSTIVYDGAGGTASVTLGSSASLHAIYTVQVTGVASVAEVSVSAVAVPGAAVGDTTPPTLISASQDLSLDEYGRVVNFTFSEAMDQVTSAHLANFVAGLPVFASSIAQPAAGILRVVFTEPMIPVLDSVTLQNLTDVHGNAFAGVTVPVAQGSSVANGFASNPELRSVPNALNDLVVVNFIQALDPEDAVDDQHWSLDVNAAPFDLSSAVFTYDFLAKSLSINLGADFPNGATFDLGPVGANLPSDVDGDDFTTTFSGVVSGDSVVPTLLIATQNRTVASDGTVIDVTFGEDLDETTAETPGNWVASGGQLPTSVDLQPSLRTVRIQFDNLLVPGETTLAINGILDLAGNSMAALASVALLSTDNVDPLGTGPLAAAIEGASNDTLMVVFSDDMLKSEVETATSWAVESPVGSSLVTAGSSVSYDEASRTATLTFVGSANFPNHEDFSLVLSNMRDLGGNVVDGTAITGTVVGDEVYPRVASVWIDAADNKVLHLRMSEPSKDFSDYFDPTTNPLALTTYQLRDNLGTAIGVPTALSVTGGLLQVNLLFASAISAGSDTLDVRGLTDLAGNQMVPQNSMAIIAEDTTAPVLEPGSSVVTTVSGEENDFLTVVFDRDMSPWGMVDAGHYSLTVGGNPAVLRDGRIEFDGTRTVVFVLDKVGSSNFEFGANHTLTTSGLTSKWGVNMVGNSVEIIVGTGDNTVPALAAGTLRLDPQNSGTTVLIELSEAVNADDGSDVTAIDISAVNPLTANHVGQRTTRAAFAAVSTGQTVNVSMRDLAGNLGIASQLVIGADVTGPAVTSVFGTIAPGVGGDSVSIVFDRPVDNLVALNHTNFVVDQGGSSITLATATPRYVSGSNTVRFDLADGVELDAATQVHVVASAVTDFSGLAMGAADMLGNVTGDSTAPTLVSAYVNHRASVVALEVEVMFSEDVDYLAPSITTNWTSDAGQFPMQVVQLDDRVFRIRFATPFSGGEQLTVTGVKDLAGNSVASLVVSVLP